MGLDFEWAASRRAGEGAGAKVLPGFFATNAVNIASQGAVRNHDSVLAQALVNYLEGMSRVQSRIDLSPCPSNLAHWLVGSLALQGMEAKQMEVFHGIVFRHPGALLLIRECQPGESDS